MKKRILIKILATILVLMLTFSNVILIGVYAVSEGIENQQASVNRTRMEFDAYFKTEDRKVHSAIFDINSQDIKLCLNFKVTEGNLNNGIVSLSESNFKFKEYQDEQGVIQSIDLQNNKIYLNSINKGSDIVIEIPIEINKDNVIDADYFTKESKLTLSGEYTNNKGETVEAQKEIKVCMQLHGEITPVLEQTFDKYVPFNTNSLKGTLIQSSVKVGVENNNLPIKQAVTIIDVPAINGKFPISATVVGKEASYDSSNGKLTITLNNDVEENQIKWNRSELVTYKIIYIYGQDTYTNTSFRTEQKISTQISVYNDIEMNTTKEIREEFILGENKNDVISNRILTNTQDLYKGFLYNSSQNETTYNTIWTADIGYTNIINEIVFSEEGDKYVFNNAAEEGIVPNYAYYKTTFVEKSNFDRILGEDGFIDIYDAAGNKIGTINKTTQMDENNNYVFDYTEATNSITLKTSKPIDNIMGEELVIRHIKALKNSVYTKEQLKLFNAIETSVNNLNARINLNEIKSAIETSVNKNTVSNAVINNVDFTIAFVTDSPQYELFKNPVVDIKLPNWINDIEIANVDMLFADGELNVESSQILQDNDGNKIIRVIISGEQTDYILNSATKGVQLFVNANITTNKFMPSQEANIEVTCTNARDNSEIKSNIKMNFESEPGVLMANSISNYNGNAAVTSLKGDTKVGTLEMNTTSKIATTDITLINNEDTDISGAVILGRLPLADNKKIVSGEELGSNFTAKLQSIIEANGINASIYYSDNELANIDLQNSENKWLDQATTDTKSYLIVLNETFNKGQTINFKYNIEIPENLGTDKTAYSNYAIYYNNQGFDSPVVGMATEFVMLTQYRDQMQDNNRNGNTRSIINNNLNIGQDYLDIQVAHVNERSNEQEIGINDQYTYMITLKNKTPETLNNISIVNALGLNVEYIESSVLTSDPEYRYIIRNNTESIYNETNHNVVCNIEELDGNEEIMIQISVKATRYDQLGIINTVAVSGENIYLTKEYTVNMKSPAYITSSIIGSVLKDELQEGQDITYTILIKNSGEDNGFVNVNYDLPEGITLKNQYYYLDGEKIEFEDCEELKNILIRPNESKKVTIEAKVDDLPDDIQKREIEFFVQIIENDVNLKTDTVKYIVKNSNYNSNIEGIKKSVSGLIWNDENKNGKKDNSESGIANIEVKIVNTEGKTIGKVTTDNEGKYKLENLEVGSYLVIFEYDSKLYSVTQYKGKDIIESLNSDAKETTYDGKKVAMTDILKIDDSSITGVNLGLIKKSIFDLKLDKYINSITVQNNQGNTTYSYTNTNFAKIEIPSKYIDSSTVIIEYKIVVTNEGDITGYAKQIVDYIPQELKFSSELNKEWYVNTDGNLYTASLADIAIEPGETKEVNLIVTKKITENNTGLITNQAEISELYNEQGIEEYDSTPANKNQNEDDISTANVIIGVKTGGAALYITITLVCVIIIAEGSYLINKKVIRGIK